VGALVGWYVHPVFVGGGVGSGVGGGAAEGDDVGAVVGSGQRSKLVSSISGVATVSPEPLTLKTLISAVVTPSSAAI
jgi:hypothetical protein